MLLFHQRPDKNSGFRSSLGRRSTPHGAGYSVFNMCGVMGLGRSEAVNSRHLLKLRLYPLVNTVVNACFCRPQLLCLSTVQYNGDEKAKNSVRGNNEVSLTVRRADKASYDGLQIFWQMCTDHRACVNALHRALRSKFCITHCITIVPSLHSSPQSKNRLTTWGT